MQVAERFRSPIGSKGLRIRCGLGVRGGGWVSVRVVRIRVYGHGYGYG